MEDKRIQNSKIRIKSGMIACLKTNNLEGISIKKLCEAVDINRCTFYAHFKSLQDVYNQIENDAVQGIDPFFDDYESGKINYRELIQAVLEFDYKHKDMVFVLLKTNLATYTDKLLYLCTIKHNINDSHFPYRNRFTFSGTFMLVYEWILNGCKESQEDLTSIILDLLSTYYPEHN